MKDNKGFGPNPVKAIEPKRSKRLGLIIAIISVPLLWIWLSMTATVFTWWSYVAAEHHILEILRLFMLRDQPMITVVLPTLLTILYIFILFINHLVGNNTDGS